MSIAEGHKANFETLRQGIFNGDACLMECQEIATGEVVAVICCAQEEDDGTITMVPFARLFNGNPYEMLRPPNPDGGFHGEAEEPRPEVNWYYWREKDGGRNTLEEGGDETTALRREWWYEAGNTYVYQGRKTAVEPWSIVYGEYEGKGYPKWVAEKLLAYGLAPSDVRPEGAELPLTSCWSGLSNMLDLSTAHIPSSEPNWGSLRVCEHEHGWVVWFCADEENLPDWFKPIQERARENECVLVNFDQDADEADGLPTYAWDGEE